MKSPITIILDRNVSDIETALKNALELHRLNDDDLNSIKNHHWDYWYFPDNPKLYDPEIANRFLGIRQEILDNTSFVKNLPKNYITTGVIDIQNNWIDLQDFGWKLIKEPSVENELATKRWNQEQKKIFDTYSENICVQVIVHN